MLLKHDFDGRRNVDEAQVSAKKRRNSLVVGGTQNRWVRAPGDPSFSRKPQSRKPFSVRALEVQGTDLCQVEPLSRQLHSTWVCQRILNWYPHVGQAELRNQSTINEFNERVNDAFWVDKHVDLIIRQAEEPVGLDNF
jgi:hypothetical protein